MATKLIDKMQHWRCSYCGYLNKQTEERCSGCGAIKVGGDNKKSVDSSIYDDIEITPYQEERMEISNKKNTKLFKFLFFLGVIIAIPAFVFLGTRIGRYIERGYNESVIAIEQAEKAKVISKEWNYLAYIASEVPQTGIVSYVKPPAGATNIVISQEMQENGWYLTKYTYDYIESTIIRTELITGGNTLPKFNEVTIAENETISSFSDVEYALYIESKSGNERIVVDKDVWKKVICGIEYPINSLIN